MNQSRAMMAAVGLAMAAAWPAQAQDRDADRGAPTRPVRVVQPADVTGGSDRDQNMVTISEFAEEVELKELVELAVAMLDINVAIDPSLSGSVAFTGEIEIPEEELLPLIDSLLAREGFSIYYDELTRFYNVVPTDTLPIGLGGPLATTRVIRTPNVKPSAMSEAIDEQLGGSKPRITYLDELGTMIATGPREQLDLLERLVGVILSERSNQELTRIELRYISSPAARQRILDLLGASSELSSMLTGAARTAAARGQVNQQQADASALGGAAGTGLENLADRLGVDPKGNALVFRGRPDEIEEVQRLVALIDVSDELVEKRYQTGTATRDIAEQARLRGLGDVVTMTGMDQLGGGQPTGRGAQNAALRGVLGDEPSAVGGSRIVANPNEGYIMYYGTAEQQLIMDRLVGTFELDRDRIVAQAYKLYHADAVEVSDIVYSLVTDQVLQQGSPLLPQQTGRNQQQPRQQPVDVPPGEEGEGVGIQPGADVFVIANPANNQVVVRAPQRLQDDVEELIRKLDLRRPQVFIDVKIVSATMSDDLRVAFETQLINASGTGGALQTNFGLTSAGDTFTDPRSVATGLTGLTSAVIKSEYVPIVVNALKTEVDGRILSSPKLLVDDNEEANISSVDQEPITTTTQGEVSDQTSFSGFEDAGTELTVTPSISAEGYLRLAYEITLSNFVGEGSNGIPPPRQDRTVSSESVTIPSDMTIIVGGIDVQAENKTISKVPILGDLPVVGHLFRDTRTSESQTVLYVFITPKILRETSFTDLSILTRGPQEQMGLDDDVPDMKPAVIPILSNPMLNDRKRPSEDGGGA